TPLVGGLLRVSNISRSKVTVMRLYSPGLKPPVVKRIVSPSDGAVDTTLGMTAQSTPSPERPVGHAPHSQVGHSPERSVQATPMKRGLAPQPPVSSQLSRAVPAGQSHSPTPATTIQVPPF